MALAPQALTQALAQAPVQAAEPARAQAQPPKQTHAPTLSAEQHRARRLDQALQQLFRALAERNPQLCRDVFVEYADDLANDWSMMALRVWHGLPGCEGHPGGAWEREPPSAETIRAAWAPVFRHFERMPVEMRLRSDLLVDCHVVYWRFLRYYNAQANASVADTEEAAVLADWYERAGRNPADPLAVASLTRLGAAVYGMRWLAAWMEVQQHRMAAVLGPGHEAVLHMMRSRIFAHRAHERPADAVALSDEYAVLAEKFHAHNPRLAMLNRSERIGALAGIGRHADAVDEGRLLLAWLQQQQPLPAANIMRAGYNLAGVALAMGDADAAEDLARLSVAHGQRATAHDQPEIVVAEWLLQQARLLKGDSAAGEALRQVLQRPLIWDLPGVEPLHTLHAWARQRGDVALAQWALGLVQRVSQDHSISLQGVRALPLALQAEAEPEGSAAGRQAAAAALAHGLATDTLAMAVRPTFALARHVQAEQPRGAAWLCKRAANTLLQWRSGLPQEQAGLPRAWLAEHDLALRRCVGLLIDQGRLSEAEQVLEVLRDEELHEFRRRSRGPKRQAVAEQALAYTPDERDRNQRIQPLQAQLRQEAAAARARADAQPDQQRRRGGHDPQAEAVVQQVGQALQQASLQAAANAAAQPQSPAGAAPPAGTVRITYVLQPGAQGQALALVQRGPRQHKVVLGGTSADISRAVAQLRRDLNGAGAGIPSAARQLHQWLMEPLKPWLDQARHLQVVPDGALRYLPFAALHDGRQYLVQRHSLSTRLATSAAPVGPATARRAPLTTARPAVAAFGRSLPSAQHGALPGVQQELAAIEALTLARVSVARDAQFTRETLTRTLQAAPQMVHLASHFVLAPASEEDSYLLLGDGERMPLRELRQLPWQGVSLALLSACDSAVPLDHDSAAQGREWAGLAAALQQAGVPDVMATLWRIDDASAARWMADFYVQWQRSGRTTVPDAAQLARTQRAWLQRHGGTELAHPRHWAGFVWLGRT